MNISFLLSFTKFKYTTIIYTLNIKFIIKMSAEEAAPVHVEANAPSQAGMTIVEALQEVLM
jgi:hypothetical protein